MAKINFIEKQKLERILNMDQGYVLDFSNRTFQEFIKDCLDIDIYKNYPNLSKAKILRAILENEKDIYVGKLINQLLKKYKKEIIDLPPPPPARGNVSYLKRGFYFLYRFIK